MNLDVVRIKMPGVGGWKPRVTSDNPVHLELATHGVARPFGARCLAEQPLGRKSPVKACQLDGWRSRGCRDNGAPSDGSCQIIVLTRPDSFIAIDDRGRHPQELNLW